MEYFKQSWYVPKVKGVLKVQARGLLTKSDVFNNLLDVPS
jgi:hypothetical protein